MTAVVTISSDSLLIFFTEGLFVLGGGVGVPLELALGDEELRRGLELFLRGGRLGGLGDGASTE